MKPIQQHQDPRITNISFDNFTGSIYIIRPTSGKENTKDFMLTSPRTNGGDNFVPSHHLALITQPVLGARSRKKTTTTTTTTNDKLDSMTNSRRSSYNDSPPLILPINRVDTSQYQKKTNSNIYHESSDSGLDLSLSTNSSVHPQQHVQIHRPLSALNEDSSPDDGYHDEHQQTTFNDVRLRFPPVSLGRNRSMEDIISNNTREQQHRSSSFSDERQQKLSVQQDQKMKRSSEGALLDLIDTSHETNGLQRRTNTIKNESLYPPPTQQHRSLNDLTNKTSNRVLPIRNESNMSTNINNLPTTQTIIRKANTSTLKPLRKKTKLNIIVEPTAPLTSSRLAVYDEQINTMTGTTSSSSNQTTPRSIRPLLQQQIKLKATTPLNLYSNQEQMRAHVNRSVVERQHPPPLPNPPRRGVIKQMIPFDASPSKYNNLLLRHHVNHHQPTIVFHPNSNTYGSTSVGPMAQNVSLSPTRQTKQSLPTLYSEETLSSVQEGKRKQKEQRKIEKFREHEEKKRLKEKEEIENNKWNENHQKGQIRIKIKDIQEPIQTNTHRQYLKSIQRQQQEEDTDSDQGQQIENIVTSTPRRQYEHNNNGAGNYRNDSRRRQPIHDANRNSTGDTYGSGQSIGTTNKIQDGNNLNRRQQRNAVLPVDRTDVEASERQRFHGLKPTELITRNKLQNQFESDSPHNTQRNNAVGIQSRASNIHFQTFETPKNRIHIVQSQTGQNSKSKNDHYPWQKTQTGSLSKATLIQPILSTNSNISDPRRERETSRLSNISKGESTKIDEKQKINEKTSNSNFRSRSPTSWSAKSDHQIDIYEKTSTHQSESSTTSPSSNDELIGRNSNTPSRTYRLMVTDEQQPSDGRYVIPANNSHVASHTSSHHTYPFSCTPDMEKSDETSPSIQTKEQKSIASDFHRLSDRDSTQDTIDRQNSPSPLVHISSNKKLHSPPLKITKTTIKDEITSNYDSDDGWSDDSAELLYVDERYATQKKKMTPPSHLSSQQHYHYQVQQQNVLLQ